MVPIPEASYFPDLGKCLKGEEILISWEAAFFALLDACENGTDSKVDKFFHDPKVLDLLSQPCNAFPKPSAATKSAFDQKARPINADHSSAEYDINLIKEDAVWLSKEAEVDEVSALRVVVEEYQSRAYGQLLGSFSEEETISLQDAAGNIKSGSLMGGTQAESTPSDAEKRETRRLRMLSIYLSDRRYFWKCLAYIYQRSQLQVTPNSVWYKSMPRQVVDRWNNSTPSDDRIVQLITAIKTNFDRVFQGNGSGWFSEDGGREELEIEWGSNQIVEATHMMEVIFHHIWSESAPAICHSSPLLEWFRFMNAFGFLNDLQLPQPALQAVVLPLQIISTIISTAILTTDSCLLELGNTLQQDRTSLGSLPVTPWLVNTAAILELHEILMTAASSTYITASPAVFSWSIILKQIRSRVYARREAQHRRNEGLDDDEEQGNGGAVVLAPDMYEGTIEDIVDRAEGDPLDFLAIRSVNHCGVFDTLSNIAQKLGDTRASFFMPELGSSMRVAILELMRAAATDFGYMSETLQVILSALDGGQEYWNLVDGQEAHSNIDPVRLFTADAVLLRTFWQEALYRYPFESVPFLKLNHALATLCEVEGGELKTVISLLERLPNFTYQLPLHFGNYETIQEEENNNSIRLTADLPLFEPRWRGANRRLLTSGGNQALVLAAAEDQRISARTCGRMIVENEPKVAFLFHSYNGARYFGKLLETFLIAGDDINAMTGEGADPETVAEIIGMFSVILLSIARSGETTGAVQDAANRFFETASSALNRNRDITLVISDIFEQELQRQSNESTSDASLAVLTSCIQYLHAMLQFSPGRVWPLIGRSGLLGIDRGSGKLSSIVGNVEIISGNYTFLVSCARLFEALVDDFAVNAIARKRNTNTPIARFSDVEEHNVRVPDQVLSKVLLSFTRYLTEVLESSCTWKFVDQDDRLQLTKTIMASFEKMLRYSFGIQGVKDPVLKPEPKVSDSDSDLDTKIDPDRGEIPEHIMGALIPAATFIAESFLSKSAGPIRFKPILQTLFDGFNAPTSTLYLNRSRLMNDDVKAALEFSRRLLQVGAVLEKSSHLETQLFSAAPLIARLYAASDCYRKPVIELFEAMIVSASARISEPPSLLGCLGAKTSKNFLHVVSELDKPLARNENVGSIWHFLSMVMSSRQQWFANYVLTGKTPRDALKQRKPDGTRSTSSQKPLLITALDDLSHIGDIPDTEALMMLEFVALAQNFWPWTMYDLEISTSFITYLSNYAVTLTTTRAQRRNVLQDCHRTRIASYIAEILAMHLFHARQIGKPSIVKDLMPKLGYYLTHAGEVPSYNSSLHGNLRKNFDTRYAACNLQSFKRTNLEHRKAGEKYFYDLDLLDKMLHTDAAWNGRRDNGYRVELISANVNISLVDAQVALLNNWKILAVELSSNIPKDNTSKEGNAKYEETLVDAALKCLNTNTKSQRTEELFPRLLQIRADFALVVCQRLMELNPSIPRMKSLLSAVWETIHSLGSGFELAPVTGDVSYYRLLLKLLFLALRVHADGKTAEEVDLRASKRLDESTSAIRIAVDVLERVVAQGFRDLAVIVHEDQERSSPEDIVLVTGILQACLRIPGIEFCHPQIVTMMANCGTARVATTLFSWSDKIAINGDPIYGELSIIFLLELSSMPAMAEQLAIDGILGHISSANITNYLRRSNVSPFADGAGIQRCYNIWVRGILPLLLNLLHSVGSSIATEVALFLNQFPHLLSSSAAAFDAPETSRTTLRSQPKYISLSICSEVHSLALIIYILNGFREQLQGIQDVPEVEWDLGTVGENVEFWLGSRLVMRERIVPMGEKDLEWRGTKLDAKKEGNLGCVDKLEEKCIWEMMGVRDVISGGDP